VRRYFVALSVHGIIYLHPTQSAACVVRFASLIKIFYDFDIMSNWTYTDPYNWNDPYANWGNPAGQGLFFLPPTRAMTQPSAAAPNKPPPPAASGPKLSPAQQAEKEERELKAWWANLPEDKKQTIRNRQFDVPPPKCCCCVNGKRTTYEPCECKKPKEKK
jgi:hypothetical protein